jgi:hypothetical protein
MQYSLTGKFTNCWAAVDVTPAWPAIDLFVFALLLLGPCRWPTCRQLWLRRRAFSAGLRLRRQPFSPRLGVRFRLRCIERQPVNRARLRLLGRSNCSRLGLDREIRLGRHVRPGWNVVLGEFGVWPRHDRRERKSRGGRRQWSRRPLAGKSRYATFQLLPLCAELLHLLRLLPQFLPFGRSDRLKLCPL